MALNPSGPISIAGTTAGQSIQVELGGTGTTQMSLNCTSVRGLAGVPTGAIVMPTDFWGKSNTIPFGCATYTTAGTYSFVVPTGASKICVVCVGGGGGGMVVNCYCCPQGAGGGGALSYSNCIPTTPGETLTVVVGTGAPAGGSGLFPPPARSPGGPSSVSRGGTTLVLARGGVAGTYGTFPSPAVGGPGGAAACGVGAVKYSGGNGAAGGAGGASGYSGNGGAGASGNGASGSPGSGGGGGGGGRGTNDQGYGAGGVGLIVEGPSGAGGTAAAPFIAAGGGSGGSPASAGAFGPGGAFGGGGGSGGDTTSTTGGGGGVGGVRIIYGGTSKTYPNNSAP